MTRLFVSDFDRTLYVNQTVSCENASAVRTWQDNGGRFAIATGRALAAVREKIAPSGLAPDYWICCNGGEIYDRNYVLLSRNCIAQEIAARIVQLLAATYFSSIGVSAAERGVKCLGMGRVDDRNGDDPVLSIEEIVRLREIVQIAQKYPTAQETRAVAAALNERFGESVTAYPNVVNLDIVAKGVNKSAAIAFLLQRCPEIGEAVAAGDSYNDLEMLRAYRSYTVESAAAEIRAAAQFVRVDVAQMLYDEMRR